MKLTQMVIVVSLLVLCILLFQATSHCQQPQTASPNPQSLQGVNAKWTNGVAPGYWPYQSSAAGCTGLNLCISAGTVPQCMGTSHVEYAGTTAFALTNNATNYVYLDLDNSCVPAVNTSGYSNRNIAIAKVTTVSGAVTQLKDDRFWGGSQVVLGGVNNQIGTTYTINATDRGKLVTATNSGLQAYTLPTTLGVTFSFALANLGTGTVTLSPASGNICSNGCAATLDVLAGSGGWLFYDGTEWNAVMGGGGGSSTVFQVNGVNLISSTTINYQNSSATNGLTLTFSNPSAGNVKLGISGTLDNGGLTNSSTTPNGQTCTLGGTCNVNSGAATHSVALNEGAGNAIGAVALGAHQTIVGAASADPGAHTIPDCQDTSGQHVNFTQSTDTWSCGTSSTTSLRGLSFSIFNPAGLVSGTTTASYDLFADVPFACTITAYSLAIDTGTITVKWWKKATGTAIPTSSDSINTSGVGVSTGTRIRSTTLTDFITASVAAHDVMIMDITAVTGSPTIVNGVLECQQ